MTQPTESVLDAETREEIKQITERNGALPNIAHKGLNAFDYICGFRKKARLAGWASGDVDAVVTHAMSGGYDQLYEIFYMTAGKSLPAREEK